MGIHPLVLAVVAALAPFCAPQLTIPPDPNNCKLNVSSPFSWVVLIHDKYKPFVSNVRKPGGVIQGTMLTRKAILTTASYFWGERLSSYNITERYTVVGHRIWDWRNNAKNARTNPCRQSQKISQIIYHPQVLRESPTRRILFDYSVIILRGYFNVAPNIFPTTFFPNSPYELILRIQYANVMNKELCGIPIPDPNSLNDRSVLVINDRIDFDSYKFHTECIGLICEDSEGRVLRDCIDILKARPNATMLCPKPTWTRTLYFGTGDPNNPYAGTPYVCNGSTYGLVTQIKKRGLPFTKYKQPRQDFFLVVTFLRIWTWLIEQIIKTSPKEKPLNLGLARLRRVTFTEPYKTPTMADVLNPQGKSASPAYDTTRSMAVLNALLAATCMAL